MKRTAFRAALVAAISFGFAGQAFAAGYEKSIMWGGRTGAVAGISTSYIMGADALYFNPAGIATGAVGNEVSLNVSPVWSNFSGPYNAENQVIDSKAGFSTPFGFIYSNNINEKLAFAIGGYISGGSKVDYENIAFTGYGHQFSTKTDLQIGEYSAGLAYKINDQWKIGAAYRLVTAKADLSFLTVGTTPFPSVTQSDATDLKDEVSAFKVGAQWAPSEKTHVGLNYRSEAKLAAAGNYRQATYSSAVGGGNAPASAVINTTATASTVFPQAVTLGADHALSDTWKLLAEAAWTEYSKVENISLATPTATSQIGQKWKDQWNGRIGAEYMGWSWPVRFGYGFTSQVTNDNYARPTFTPPGASHTITAGSGQTFQLMGQKLTFNGAAEYTMVSGTANAGTAETTATDVNSIRPGKHETTSYALHLGLAYNF